MVTTAAKQSVSASYWSALTNDAVTHQAIEKIARFDLSEIRSRVLKEGHVGETHVDEAIDEFRKYLMLIRLGHRGLAMTSPQVDEIWHAFILFTLDYSRFCNSVFGGYLHHQPNTEKSPMPDDFISNFRTSYKLHFGELPEIWRRGTAVLGCSAEMSECATTNCQDKDCYVCASCKDN